MTQNDHCELGGIVTCRRRMQILSNKAKRLTKLANSLWKNDYHLLILLYFIFLNVICVVLQRKCCGIYRNATEAVANTLEMAEFDWCEVKSG